jgi:hypothetical protein
MQTEWMSGGLTGLIHGKAAAENWRTIQYGGSRDFDQVRSRPDAGSHQRHWNQAASEIDAEDARAANLAQEVEVVRDLRSSRDAGAASAFAKRSRTSPR